MIFTGFHPNIYKKDVSTALSFLFLPWKWSQLKKGNNIIQVENWLQNYFSVKYAITFDSGRTALQKAIEATDIKYGDEVLVQAYTCLVVSNAINWAGAKPVYVDINEDLNMSVEDLKKKITPKSKILIIQHTFGKAADLENLLQIAKENNLIVIEDCAHTIGGKYQDKLIGTWGDIGMFSFGTDKVISSSRGGALITNNDKIAEKIMLLNKKLPESSTKTILQNLCNFPIFYIGKALYDVANLGKLGLSLAQKMGITGKIIYKEEKSCHKLNFYPAKYPNSLAKILLNQLQKLEQMNKHRQEISEIYDKMLVAKNIQKPQISNDEILLRYTILVDNPKNLIQLAKKKRIILGNWYDSVIAPNDKYLDIERTGYIKNSCPKAEYLATRSINLPINKDITYTQAKLIVELINNNV
ncbi:MAG: DegT/DnrJ/eryc1/StrS aminotransferase [uncultured bacterium]|nr:MAG: DegT/DnrJ/eryc1/StrS aminotransferase [uncultured bacterium]OGH84450.1 MAG: hypothetical protein A2488_02605 [Candidatus Magasanikbacteria bacterium RIFOXYC12_FULL_32_21b]OGH89472.1 MAG: hypothetical protein A2507_04360 [Candidatus Magasanikbacteria bacterium RIFOXYD12_FULL_33_17]HAO52075.1 hypothetical protein [Candidatus Magasanikbacteria bacterium]